MTIPTSCSLKNPVYIVVWNIKTLLEVTAVLGKLRQKLNGNFREEVNRL